MSQPQLCLPADFSYSDPAANLGGLLPGVLKALGRDLPLALTANSPYTPLEFPAASRALVVLVDGLGRHNIEARRGHVPFIKRYQQVISTVSPSTTAAALTTLGTAASPAQTGMLSYALRDTNGQSFSLIAWKDTEETPETWQTTPTLAQIWKQNFPDDELRFVNIGLAKFAGSGLTQCAFRDWQQLSAPLEARVDKALYELKKGGLVYLYWGDLDKAGHKMGWQSDRWTAELEKLDSDMQKIARRLPKDTLLVLSADHGMIDVETRIDIAKNPRLAPQIAQISGEERGLHIYLTQNNDANVSAQQAAENRQKAKEEWQAEIGCHGVVATKEEIIASGFWGRKEGNALPVCHSDAAGDLVILATENYVHTDSRYATPASLEIKGVHGSLTSEEMQVPLLTELA